MHHHEGVFYVPVPVGINGPGKPDHNPRFVIVTITVGSKAKMLAEVTRKPLYAYAEQNGYGLSCFNTSLRWYACSRPTG